MYRQRHRLDPCAAILARHLYGEDPADRCLFPQGIHFDPDDTTEAHVTTATPDLPPVCLRPSEGPQKSSQTDPLEGGKLRENTENIRGPREGTTEEVGKVAEEGQGDGAPRADGGPRNSVDQSGNGGPQSRETPYPCEPPLAEMTPTDAY